MRLRDAQARARARSQSGQLLKCRFSPCHCEDILRLTHIKLAGFKSFVDPTSIAVPGQLVAVIG